MSIHIDLIVVNSTLILMRFDLPLTFFLLLDVRVIYLDVLLTFLHIEARLLHEPKTLLIVITRDLSEFLSVFVFLGLSLVMDG